MNLIVALVLAQVPVQADAPMPEHRLRMAYQKGAVRRFEITSTHRVKGVPPSTVTLSLQREILEVKKDRARINMKLEALSFGDDDPRNAVFAKLMGASWRGWVDDRGRFETMTLVPPADMPVLLHPMVKHLERLLPGQALPLPEQALRLGDDWQIAAKDLAAAPDGSWAKSAQGGLTCTLIEADKRRATIELKLNTPLSKKKKLTGKGRMIIDLRSGALETFQLTSRLQMQTTIAGGTRSSEVEHDYRLSSRPGDTP